MNTKMKKFMAVVAISAILIPTIANAETIDYACQFGEGGKFYPLHIDEGKNTLTWQGKQYAASGYGDTDGSGEVCPKYCYDAVGNGTSFRIETATQGYATFWRGNKKLGIQCFMKGSRGYVKP
jgi:hypothetical protein